MRKWIDQLTFDELLLANAEDNVERAIQSASAVLEANFTKTLHRIRFSSRSAIPTVVWVLSADWFITGNRTARAVSSKSRFTVG